MVLQPPPQQSSLGWWGLAHLCPVGRSAAMPGLIAPGILENPWNTLLGNSSNETYSERTANRQPQTHSSSVVFWVVCERSSRLWCGHLTENNISCFLWAVLGNVSWVCGVKSAVRPWGEISADLHSIHNMIPRNLLLLKTVSHAPNRLLWMRQMSD